MRQRSASTPSASGGESGFTLVELAVSLFVLVEVLVAALFLMDFNSKLAQVQLQVTDMQQSLRASRYALVKPIRIAGRGGLLKDSPGRAFPLGGAVELRNDVGNGGRSKEVAIGYAGGPTAMPGTDILTVRGVFAGPIYQIRPDGSSFTLYKDASYSPGMITTDPTQAVSGKIHVCNRTTLIKGLAQDLTPLKQALGLIGAPSPPPIPEALLIVSPIDPTIYGVVELDPANSVVGSAPCTDPDDVGSTGLTLAFRVRNSAGGIRADSFRRLSSAPAGSLSLQAGPALQNVAAMGILEEYRYYVRENYAVTGDATSQARPRLAQARMFPGTEDPYGTTGPERTANLQVDIADGVDDLQVALGMDRNGDGAIGAEGAAGAAAVADEWLYNDPADVPGDATWLNAQLYYLRITTLGRTQRRDRTYQAPLLTTIEDRSYAADAANSRNNRMFRRRILQSVIDLRNL